jgi:hypothetical protein
MKTTMWTKDPPLMSGSPRTWYVAPQTDGKSTDPALENGFILSLIWEEKFGPPLKDEAPAPKPQLVDLPKRVYSILTALLAIAAALLVLTFLRQH